ncbi:MAG: hypothetical protein K2X66_18720 [Cyanobacteria bacterium]|nr:hypothetical protein [Cyanobacteriota bacterium]
MNSMAKKPKGCKTIFPNRKSPEQRKRIHEELLQWRLNVRNVTSYERAKLRKDTLVALHTYHTHSLFFKAQSPIESTVTAHQLVKRHPEILET